MADRKRKRKMTDPIPIPPSSDSPSPSEYVALGRRDDAEKSRENAIDSVIEGAKDTSRFFQNIKPLQKYQRTRHGRRPAIYVSQKNLIDALATTVEEAVRVDPPRSFDNLEFPPGLERSARSVYEKKRKSISSADIGGTAAVGSSHSSASLSPYEIQRLENIKRNRAVLVALGLAPERFTVKATGTKAPLRRQVVRKEPSRRSTRIASLASRSSSSLKKHSNATTSVEGNAEDENDVDNFAVRERKPATARQKALAAKRLMESKKGSCSKSKSSSRTSIKFLDIDLDRLDKEWVGKIVPPIGGQVKRAVMDLASAVAPPKFSRMSGIQEWKNAVMLFVNVYGNEYKNVFLEDGRQITWFAQSRQWDGTPVIQRLVHCAGGSITFANDDVDEDGVLESVVEFDETPVLLFCRNLNKGYVYCGRLSYLAHEPSRIPIRFVWKLNDFEALRESEPFQALVRECNSIIGA